MNLSNINKKNTREWSLFNENSKSALNRSRFTEKYGGQFIKTVTGWIWNEKIKKIIKFPDTKKKRTTYIFTDKNGIQYVTDNFEGFCRDRSINSSAMYDVISGKRKTFKGFKVVRVSPEDKG